MATFRPGKPYWLGRRTTNFATVVGTTAITWDSVESDGTFGPSTSGSQQEISLAGLYVVHMGLRKASGAATSSLQGHLLVNGTVASSAAGNQAAGQQGTQVTVYDQLEAGDIIVAQVQTTVSVALEAASTRLAIVRIGPKRWT